MKKGKMEKEKEVNGRGNGIAFKALFGTSAIVITSVLIFIIADAIMPFRRIDMRMLMINHFLISSLLTLFVGGLSIYLIYTYLKDYLELRSRFTLGVLLAVVSFLMFAITSSPLLHMLLGIYGRMEGLFSVIPMVFAAISLGVLAWISSR